jgi:hypothetical protein
VSPLRALWDLGAAPGVGFLLCVLLKAPEWACRGQRGLNAARIALFFLTAIVLGYSVLDSSWSPALAPLALLYCGVALVTLNAFSLWFRSASKELPSDSEPSQNAR